MNQNNTEYVTTECPNGHRVRGDLGWINRQVSCPHCQAEFVFQRPDSLAANVVAVQAMAQPMAQTSSGGEQRSGNWASDTGVMRILGDYVPPPAAEGRRCGDCGTANPAGTSICETCGSKLLPAERGTKTVANSAKNAPAIMEPIDFREVDKVAFEDVPVRRVIRPRREIVFLDIGDSLEKMQKQVRQSMHSRYPVCERSLDKILGLVHIKDILVAQEEQLNIRSLLETPETIPDSTPVSKVLQHFHDEGVPMAFVVDEYDNVIGIVTLKDVLSKLAKSRP